MQLSPRYDGPVVLSIEDEPASQLAPLVRQRRRFETVLAGFDDDRWGSPSRCDGWTARDVVAHLVSVNEFWTASVLGGLSGQPTRWLAGFDPAATPPLLVGSMAELSPAQVLDRFVATNDALLAALDGLTPEQWSMPAETPPGHLPIRLLAQHGLWDSWVHERDVLLPLGLEPAVEPDEVVSCLRYAAALSPVLGAGVGRVATGSFGLVATDPDVRCRLEVGESVTMSAADSGVGPDDPVLRGPALGLTEALSLRAPLPADTPPEWRELLGGIEAASS